MKRKNKNFKQFSRLTKFKVFYCALFFKKLTKVCGFINLNRIDKRTEKMANKPKLSTVLPIAFTKKKIPKRQITKSP
jgi:hypothetical protein